MTILDRDAMAQLVHALDMARVDADKLGKLADSDALSQLAEKYAEFLLCGNAAKDVIANVFRTPQGRF